MNNEEIKKAIDSSQRAQRNYDLSKDIPHNDLETMIYAARNSPSKQNETHYGLHVFTDQKIIKEVYHCTKRFCLIDKNDNIDDIFGEKNGVYWQSDERSVHNSQTLANVLFVYTDDNNYTRGCSHIVGQDNETTSSTEYIESKNFSIGISVGELILSASLLGYKTGLCASWNKKIEPIINSDKTVKLLVGIGHANEDMDRRLHPEVMNKDVPEKFRNGELDQNWRFPSFEKHIKVNLNGKDF